MSDDGDVIEATLQLFPPARLDDVPRWVADPAIIEREFPDADRRRSLVIPARFALRNPSDEFSVPRGIGKPAPAGPGTVFTSPGTDELTGLTPERAIQFGLEPNDELSQDGGFLIFDYFTPGHPEGDLSLIERTGFSILRVDEILEGAGEIELAPFDQNVFHLDYRDTLMEILERL